MNITMITQQHIFSSFYWQNRPAPKVQIYLWATSSFPPVWGNPPNFYCIPYFFYANLSKTGTVTLRHKGQKQNQIFLPWFYTGGGFQASLKVLLRNIITPHFCPDFLRATPSLELGKTLPLDFFFTAATQDNLTRKRGAPAPTVDQFQLLSLFQLPLSMDLPPLEETLSSGTEQRAQQHLTCFGQQEFYMFLSFYFILFFSPLVSHWLLFGEKGVLLSQWFSCFGLFFFHFFSPCTTRSGEGGFFATFSPDNAVSYGSCHIGGGASPHLVSFLPGSPWGLACLHLVIITVFLVVAGFFLFCFVLFCFSKLVFFHISFLYLSLLVSERVRLKLKGE